MRHSKWLFALLVVVLALVPALLVGGATPASGVTTTQGAICPEPQPGGVAGEIPTTLTIMRDAWLACDVQCLQLDGQPCINFGRPNIKFSLNGFKMTGPANEPPRSNCVTDSQFNALEADGIHSKFDEVQVVGPGLVQRMRRHGIGLVGSAADPVEKAQVKKVTSHQNCFSGVFMGFVNNSLVDEVVSVRNSANSGFRPCGGVCITNSNKNVIRRSEFAGTGAIAPSGPPVTIPPVAGIPNDFGIGLVGSSSENLIEENGSGGNINGLALFPIGAASPTNNVIKRNVLAGNPPIQISADNPALNPVGSDIRDFSAPGSNNRFENNLCITYTAGPTTPTPSPLPCAGGQHDADTMFEPKLPQYAGHQNN